MTRTRIQYYFFYNFLVTLMLNQPVTGQTRFTIFEDNFDDNRNAWSVGDRPKTLAKIDSGVFYLESKRPRAGYGRRVTQGFFYPGQDFEISVRLEKVKGDSLRGYGLKWGGDPLKNLFHEVWLRDDQKVGVSTYGPGQPHLSRDHLPYTHAPSVKPTGFNEITVRKEEDQLTIYVNNIEVYQMPYPGIFGPEVGFIGPAGGAIRVDYLRLSILNEHPSPIFSSQNTPNVYLVTVGIADYLNDDRWNGFTDLTFTTNDARAIKDFFQNDNIGAVPEENLSLLLDQNATKQQILRALKNQLSKAWFNDLVIFYFSGHGIRVDSSLYLLPYDFEIGDLSTGIHYKEIEAIFESVSAQNKVMIIDACHSGGALAQQKGNFKELLGSLDNKEMAILTSSGLGETSLELGGDIERGLFSFHLTNALSTGISDTDMDSDGIITIIELYTYASQHTREVANQRGHEQNPQIGGKLNPRLPLAITNE